MNAIAVAILSAVAGFLVWIAQRYYERRAAERLRKEELYRTLLAASIELFTTGDGAPFVVESQQAWLYASDEVLENINACLKAFSAYADTKRLEVDSADMWATVKEAEGRLQLSIRKDLRPKTQSPGMGNDNIPPRANKTLPMARFCFVKGKENRIAMACTRKNRATFVPHSHSNFAGESDKRRESDRLIVLRDGYADHMGKGMTVLRIPQRKLVPDTKGWIMKINLTEGNSKGNMRMILYEAINTEEPCAGKRHEGICEGTVG